MDAARLRHVCERGAPAPETARAAGTAVGHPVDTRAPAVRLAEAVAVAACGGALAFGIGIVVLPSVAIAAASIAVLNGAVCGWHGTYAWRRPDGWLAFVLDSTWACAPVLAGLIAHVGALVRRDAGYVAWLGHRQNRHVYRRGVALKAGFAFTIGNVISGAGDVDRPRRRRLITDHEDVHVWQSRWFGPLYPLLYVAWSAGGAVVACGLWLARRRRGDRVSLGKLVESVSYYTNPFEWWAYSRDDLWPPPGKVADVGWRSSAARPLSTLARRAHRRPPG